VTTNTLKHPRVEFLAASARLANAFRIAAKRNKKLALGAAVHELGHVAAAAGKLRSADEYQIVVLSHADDDPRALTDRRVQKMVSGAFHLLFTGPTTHPDQVAQWMRATKIRSENRLHVVRVEKLDAPQTSDLLGRVCSAFGQDANRGSIIDGYLVNNTLLVRGPKQRMLHVPVASIPALRDQPVAVLQNFRIDPDGSFIHWPDLDIHLGWSQFLQAVDPAELRRAQQRSATFNRRYGAAIRKIREAAGISQSQVAGLTDRQLRRIEHGLCRATASALNALAKAHGLDVNLYMDKLAAAIG
jgi:hypothetical protein